MPEFSSRSKERLATCHSDLQRLFNEVIKLTDCMVLCGFRGEAEQNKAFAEGKSKLKWPHGKHNQKPSLAVDVVPYPLDWTDNESFLRLMSVVKSQAEKMGIDVECGGEWKSFKDLPHYQLRGV